MTKAYNERRGTDTFTVKFNIRCWGRGGVSGGIYPRGTHSMGGWLDAFEEEKISSSYQESNPGLSRHRCYWEKQFIILFLFAHSVLRRSQRSSRIFGPLKMGWLRHLEGSGPFTQWQNVWPHSCKNRSTHTLQTGYLWRLAVKQAREGRGVGGPWYSWGMDSNSVQP